MRTNFRMHLQISAFLLSALLVTSRTTVTKLFSISLILVVCTNSWLQYARTLTTFCISAIHPQIVSSLCSLQKTVLYLWMCEIVDIAYRYIHRLSVDIILHLAVLYHQLSVLVPCEWFHSILSWDLQALYLLNSYCSWRRLSRKEGYLTVVADSFTRIICTKAMCLSWRLQGIEI